MKKYILEIIVFITGMGILVFEIIGARVLASYVGTTITVWSVLIAVILGALSLGYWWGGKIADKKTDSKTLGLILLMAGFFVAVSGIVKLPLINFLDTKLNSFKWETIWASLILFAPGSFFMAAISPYAVRLRVASIKESGEVVGNLYAISTVGSILGALLTGIVLVPLIGNTKIIFSLASLLILASILAFSGNFKIKMAMFLLTIAAVPLAGKIDYYFLPIHFVQSAYQDIAINKGVDVFSDIKDGEPTGRPTLEMYTGPNTIQSAMFADDDNDLVIPYTRFFRVLSEFFHPHVQNALVIGGAGYSLPKDFLKRNPGSDIDVVEIDPTMTEIAKKYFNLPKDPRLSIFTEDGRTYLNRNQKKYDEIFIDSFRTFVAPYQLTTLETAQHVYDSLSDKGIVLVNIIQAINGDYGKFFRAEYKTYKQVFPQVFVYRVQSHDPITPQNIIMVGLKSSDPVQFISDDPQTNAYLDHAWNGEIEDDQVVLTDDFAPVADYMLAANRYLHN